MKYTKDEILTQYETHLQVNDKDHDAYYFPVKKYLEYCEVCAVEYDNKDEIVFAFLEGFILSLKTKQLAQNTIFKYLNSIRFFYKFLVNRKLIDSVVIEELYKVKVKREGRKIKEFLTKKELDELIEMAQGWYTAMDMYKMKALLYFMFFTGVRIGEIVNLKRKYINLEEKESIIKLPSKNKRERYIYFTKEVKKLVSIYYDTEPENFNAFNVTKPQIRYLIDYLEDFINKTITPHTLRHSFAHYLALNEVDIKVAQKLLGHKSLASTEIYYDPTKETVKKIYQNKLG